MQSQFLFILLRQMGFLLPNYQGASSSSTVVFCHPGLVETGMNLIAWPEIVFAESTYSLYRAMQAHQQALAEFVIDLLWRRLAFGRELGQHLGVERIGLGAARETAGERVGMGRIDHADGVAGLVQRDGERHPIAAGGFAHHQRGGGGNAGRRQGRWKAV